MKDKNLKSLVINCGELSNKIRFYHWNVRGRNFVELHMFFEEQYNLLNNAVDIFAERCVIRSGNFFLDQSDRKELLMINAAEDNFDVNFILSSLLSDNQKIIDLLKQIRNEYSSDDAVTESEAINLLTTLEKSNWFVKAMIG